MEVNSINPYRLIPYIRYSIFRQCPNTLWNIEKRTIPDHEFVLVIKGGGFVIIEDEKTVLKPGTLLYFHPGQVHSLESDSNNPLFFYAIHFSYTYFEYNNNIWSLEASDFFQNLQPIMMIGNNAKIIDLFNEFNLSWTRKEIGYELSCNGLFMLILRCIMRNSNENSTNFAVNIKLESILTYIEEHIDKNISMKEISDLVSLSPDYISSQFKKYNGYPIIKYFNMRKIDKAKQILMERNDKIKDIALALGFKDEFYFSRVFKRFEGMSPKEFREKVNNWGITTEKEPRLNL